jgi:hypothetical protein
MPTNVGVQRIEYVAVLTYSYNKQIKFLLILLYLAYVVQQFSMREQVEAAHSFGQAQKLLSPVSSQ